MDNLKTIKQLADELKIDKQKVYRYIKKHHINESLQKNGVMYYDEAVGKQIKQAFSQNEPRQKSTSEVHQEHINETLIDMLKIELEQKNKQIDELHKLLNQQQILTAQQQQKIELLEAKNQEEPRKKWWWQK